MENSCLLTMVPTSGFGGDRNFEDTKLAKKIKAGASKLESHFGHHGIAFLNNQKVAVTTNPGDGTLSIIDLQKQEIIQTIEIGGVPTKLTRFGDSM